MILLAARSHAGSKPSDHRSSAQHQAMPPDPGCSNGRLILPAIIMFLSVAITACGPEKVAPPPACKWKYVGEEVDRATLKTRHRLRCPERNEELVTEWE